MKPLPSTRIRPFLVYVKALDVAPFNSQSKVVERALLEASADVSLQDVNVGKANDATQGKTMDP